MEPVNCVRHRLNDSITSNYTLPTYNPASV